MRNVLKPLGRVLAMTIAAGSIVLATGSVSAQTSNEAERNRMLVAHGLQAWADGTGSPYDLLADNVQWTITGHSLAGKTYPSKEAFLSEVIRPFNARMRDRLIPTVHRLYAEGDTVIAYFNARGVARDGQPYVNTYAWILRMQGGQIVEAQAFFDAPTFDDLWSRVSPNQD